MNVLELAGLTVKYRTWQGRRVALAGLDTGLEKDRLVGLVGPNRAGKSTLLHTVSGLQPPPTGSVRLLGRDLGRMWCGKMVQQVAVVLIDRVGPGYLTAADIVALDRYLHTGWPGRLGVSDRKAITAALEAVGVGELAKRMLWGLSDGQRRRVMITHAIAQTPRLLLLDEPAVFLDPPGQICVFKLLQDLAYGRGFAVVVYTYDMEVATRHTDRLWVVGSENGIRVGAPHELAHDDTLEAVFGGGAGFGPDSYTFVSHRLQPDWGGHQGNT